MTGVVPDLTLLTAMALASRGRETPEFTACNPFCPRA